MDYLQYSTL